MLTMNTQSPEKRVERSGGALDVFSVFPTIQGEGPFVGRPAVFVRLAGCNLRCPACDTDYTTGRRLMAVKDILDDISTKRGGTSVEKPLIVITGGEPFRQNCGPLVGAAIAAGYVVQFETNGTCEDRSMEGMSSGSNLVIVCSPKSAAIHQFTYKRGHYLKYVLRAGEVDDKDGLPTSSLLSGVRPHRPIPGDPNTLGIYVQPLDEQDSTLNKLNTDAAIESCQRFGYRLCIQSHKLVGLP